MQNQAAPIVFHCSECDEEMEIHPRKAGEYVQCVECGEEVRVPRREGRAGVQDAGLSATEYLLFTLLFVAVPMANVWVSSILYYTWKSKQPRRANQINWLGFLVLGCQVLLVVLICVLVAAWKR